MRGSGFSPGQRASIIFLGLCGAVGVALATFALGIRLAYYHFIPLEAMGLIVLPTAPLAALDYAAFRPRAQGLPRWVFASLSATGFGIGIFAVAFLTLQVSSILEFSLAFPVASAIIASANRGSRDVSAARATLLAALGVLVTLTPAVLSLLLLLEPGCTYGRCIAVASSGTALFALLFSVAMLGVLAGVVRGRRKTPPA